MFERPEYLARNTCGTCQRTMTNDKFVGTKVLNSRTTLTEPMCKSCGRAYEALAKAGIRQRPRFLRNYPAQFRDVALQLDSLTMSNVAATTWFASFATTIDKDYLVPTAEF